MELYAALQFVWWLLLGVLLIGLAVMVGMDMGVGTILRYVGRTDTERRVALNIIGPHWDGNQVWFILGGGAVFAAFPLIYATAFSGFYVVMLLLLWSMIVRPLGFEYRSKLPSARWRNVWDWSLFVSGLVPMVVFGAAFGNLFQGVPFHFSWNLTSTYTGSFLALLNPFAILCGLLSASLSIFMGAATVMNGATGVMYDRARQLARIAALVAIALFAIGGLWVHGMTGFVLSAGPGAGVAQTPLQQTVVPAAGAWFANFQTYPVLWIVPALAVAGMLLGWLAAGARRSHLAWWLGAIAWLGVIGTAGVALFPFLLPSSSVPAQSLTVWNASSSKLTLTWMVGFAVFFVPLILWYTSWAFYVMRGKVSAADVEADEHAY
ncbi:cytochrome d oxidase cyd subunit II [Pandoraea thiooxydans]|uniref:Cytochrome d ubiquinol oxidase subunit 2 n=1 Tax=Pandoraea thiooxydans TaxID=445709 RepID=A0A0G3ENP7_9BURK|nr:cytochrome d ubiquinol oxidase subunit II [Pandoraea thiooxydans]AKJ67629.1 cytochrome d ubiquinol oxidase subunit II [Pandoraea thiooxydans]APR94732.1 cytochrome d oxidase cyd subunit II [Pandoraea thiooxydans]